MDYDPAQAVAFALSGKPIEFENQVQAGLADRILDSIEAKRVETASKVFGTPEYFAANDPEPEAPAETENTEAEVETPEVEAEKPETDDET